MTKGLKVIFLDVLALWVMTEKGQESVYIKGLRMEKGPESVYVRGSVAGKRQAII